MSLFSLFSNLVQIAARSQEMVEVQLTRAWVCKLPIQKNYSLFITLLLYLMQTDDDLLFCLKHCTFLRYFFVVIKPTQMNRASFWMISYKERSLTSSISFLFFSALVLVLSTFWLSKRILSVKRFYFLITFLILK